VKFIYILYKHFTFYAYFNNYIPYIFKHSQMNVITNYRFRRYIKSEFIKQFAMYTIIVHSSKYKERNIQCRLIVQKN